jgi:hypothetical protein
LDALKREEDERLSRLKHIRAKERELLLLKHIPVEDYISYERFRNESCARIVQRAWRKARGYESKSYDPFGFGDTKSRLQAVAMKAGALGAPSKSFRKSLDDEKKKEEEAEGEDPVARQHRLKLFDTVMRAVGGSSLVSGSTAGNSEALESMVSKLIHPLEVDALGLAQMHRKIKDNAAEKIKARDRAVPARYPLADSANMSVHQQTPLPAAGPGYLNDSFETGKSIRKPAQVGSTRRKYQDVLQYQQQAQVLLDEYLGAQELRSEKQVERLYTLGHCKRLSQDLRKPLSLDEARSLIAEGKGEVLLGGTGYPEASQHEATETNLLQRRGASSSNLQVHTSSKEGAKSVFDSMESFDNLKVQSLGDMLWDVPTAGLQVMVKSHMRTIGAMKDKRRWGLVATPHDCTGPPVDIAFLAKEQEAKRASQRAAKEEQSRKIRSIKEGMQRKTGSSSDRAGKGDEGGTHEGLHAHALASDWADGIDIEESLYWASYASQPSKYATQSATGVSRGVGASEGGVDEDPEHRGGWTSMGNLSHAPTQQKAQEMMGEVEGEKLIRALSRQALGSMKCRDAVRIQCAKEDERVTRLSQVFTDEAVGLIYRNMAQRNLSNLTKEEEAKHGAAALRVQSLFRGNKGRKLAEAHKADHRVLDALQNLVTELSRPEVQKSEWKKLATGGPGGLKERLLAMQWASSELSKSKQGVNALSMSQSAGTKMPPRSPRPPDQKRGQQTQSKARQITSFRSGVQGTASGSFKSRSDSPVRGRSYTNEPVVIPDSSAVGTSSEFAFAGADPKYKKYSELEKEAMAKLKSPAMSTDDPVSRDSGHNFSSESTSIERITQANSRLDGTSSSTVARTPADQAAVDLYRKMFQDDRSNAEVGGGGIVTHPSNVLASTEGPRPSQNMAVQATRPQSTPAGLHDLQGGQTVSDFDAKNAKLDKEIAAIESEIHQDSQMDSSSPTAGETQSEMRFDTTGNTFSDAGMFHPLTELKEDSFTGDTGYISSPSESGQVQSPVPFGKGVHDT